MTLEFTLTHDGNSPTDATNITFTDDLNAALNGLASTSGTLTDICGIGSQITGTTSLTFTGGTLAPGASCTFSVTLQVPAMAAAGSFTNNTSNSMATVNATTVTGPAGSDDLLVAGLILAKSFSDDPVIAGGTVTLEFTINNTDTTQTATNILFQDDLDSTLSNLSVAPASVPATPCATGSMITLAAGNTFLTFSGGTPG